MREFHEVLEEIAASLSRYVSARSNLTSGVTLNTKFNTLWSSPGNFTSAGSILTNDTLADRGGPWA